jgi:hypothetical protein
MTGHYFIIGSTILVSPVQTTLYSVTCLSKMGVVLATSYKLIRVTNKAKAYN